MIHFSEDAVLAGFYDFKSDGIMDVMFTKVKENNREFVTRGNDRKNPMDGSFLTVKVN